MSKVPLALGKSWGGRASEVYHRAILARQPRAIRRIFGLCTFKDDWTGQEVHGKLSFCEGEPTGVCLGSLLKGYS
ncbi:MAG: hypothetical protein RBR15_07215 [Sphaerochaeta sp.]|nr:hypothetical protein [Sphaerochaeta sp.]